MKTPFLLIGLLALSLTCDLRASDQTVALFVHPPRAKSRVWISRTCRWFFGGIVVGALGVSIAPELQTQLLAPWQMMEWQDGQSTGQSARFLAGLSPEGQLAAFSVFENELFPDLHLPSPMRLYDAAVLVRHPLERTTLWHWFPTLPLYFVYQGGYRSKAFDSFLERWLGDVAKVLGGEMRPQVHDGRVDLADFMDRLAVAFSPNYSFTRFFEEQLRQAKEAFDDPRDNRSARMNCFEESGRVWTNLYMIYFNAVDLLKIDMRHNDRRAVIQSSALRLLENLPRFSGSDAIAIELSTLARQTQDPQLRQSLMKLAQKRPDLIRL